MNLVIWSSLERHRTHDQHPGDAAQLAEKGGGGHRLRRLAEPHLVPEQRALGERQVQQAVDLVRIEGQLERGEGTTAGAELLLHILAFDGQRGAPRPAGGPEGHLLADPHRRTVAVQITHEGRHRLSGIALQAAVAIDVPAEDRGDRGSRLPLRKNADHRRFSASPPHEHFDARRAAPALKRGPPRGRAAQAGHHGLDVLARGQAVGPEVRTRAGVLALRERADLHLVAGAARRPDREGGEDRLRRLEDLDPHQLA